MLPFTAETCIALDSVVDVCRRKNVTSKKTSPERQRQQFRDVGRTVRRGTAAHDDDVKDDAGDDVELDDEVFDKCASWLRDVATANK